MHADAEAMKEIEARMVEILAERGVMKEGIISDDDVLAIKNQMGEPRDFSDDSEDSTDELTDDNEKPEKATDARHGRGCHWAACVRE